MKTLLFLILVSGSVLVAQDSTAPSGSQKQDLNKDVTVQGCLERSRGDYVLTQQNPGMTYQLQGTGKLKLRDYVGQRVEIMGLKQSTLSTSSDAITFGGSPSPVTIRVKSIKTVDNQCSERPVSR